MRVQFDNKLISSFAQYLDHYVQEQGVAYSNHSGLLYRINSRDDGLYAYATPFKQLVRDTAISGANVMSGVYLNGNFVTIGQSGLSRINHDEGTVYFTGQLPANTVISGNYAIKDFNVDITENAEYKLLTMTKYVTNSKFNQVLSGLPSDTRTTPAIFLKAKDTDNKPFALGGIDDNAYRIRAIVITDNEFQRIAVCNIMKNLRYKVFSVVDSTPMDYLGNFTGLNYNYDNLNFNTGYSCLVMEAKARNIPMEGDFADLGRSVAEVDFTISTLMRHS
jgi:hypothetical protein